jgi:hypothetical protein
MKDRKSHFESKTTAWRGRGGIGTRNPLAGTHWRWFNYGVEVLRNVVQAAAENTSTLATMTGDALISMP